MRNLSSIINKEFINAGLGHTDIKGLNLAAPDLETNLFLNLENIIWNFTFRLEMIIRNGRL